MHHAKHVLTRLGAIAFLAASTGCPANLEDPGRFTSQATSGSCPDVPQAVLLPDCATANCHSTADKMQGLDLQSPNVASRLVGVSSTEGPGLLIDPSNPQASVIYTKLTASPPFGVRMPFSQPPLADATTACVLAWVTAQVDGGAGDASASETDASAGDDAAPTEEASTGGDDGSSDDGSSGDDASDDASTPVVDAGSPHDAGHTKDGSTQDAGPRDAGTSD
jgi:hypothetical protein